MAKTISPLWGQTKATSYGRGFFTVFGSHVQYTYKQRKWTESEFDKLKEMNEKLQREITEIKKE